MTALHRHHRKLRPHGVDNRPVNILNIPLGLHDWIHKNPEEAHELGWIVKSFEEPEDVSVTIPETVLAKKKARKKLEKIERINTQIRTPKGEQNVLPDLIDQFREKHKEEMGWQDDVPDYYPTVAALVLALQS